MAKVNLTQQLLLELQSNLPTSSGAQRKVWANYIVKNKISLKKLFPLLCTDQKVANRFSWLLGDMRWLNKPGHKNNVNLC
ncbi:MAG: hypothetical protein GY810_10240 [Aureispira sp.]|nr:hypothetical protein [Aureispira sp.]